MKKISDLASDFLILILQLRANKEFGELLILKERIQNLLDQFEREARCTGIDSENIQMTRFALVAFTDETILGSDWEYRDDWQAEPLQLKLYNSYNAGEEFFTRLNQLRLHTRENADALELYYLCLSLGFKGKFQLHSPEQVRRITEELYNDLPKDSKRSIELLSPNGIPHDEIVHVVKERIPLWVFVIIAFALGLMLYIGLSVSVSSLAEEVLQAIIKLFV